jgi:hypothetical protein
MADLLAADKTAMAPAPSPSPTATKAASSAESSKEGARTDPPPSDTPPVQWAEHLKDEYVLIKSTGDFIVWLDENRDVEWETTQAYDEELEKKGFDFGDVSNRVAFLQAVPTNHLSHEIKTAYRTMLGEGLCRGLEQDNESAMTILDQAEEFVTARNREQARLWYVAASGTATLSFVLLTPAVAYGLPRLLSNASDATSNVLLAGLGGATGALFSILLRVGKAPLDPSAGRPIHLMEGFGRIVVGVIGAAIVLSASRAGFILPNLTSNSGLALLCLVAGASERLVPGLVDSVELSASNSGKATASSAAEKTPKSQPGTVSRQP